MEMTDARSHAYLLSAPAEEGYAAACALAKAMLCSGEGARPCGVCENCRKVEKGIHPDLITITRQTDDKGRPRREIYVEQIRAIVADAVVLPNEADVKVYVIRDAGTMNPAAQNALLKILEEPPRFAAFILVTDNARDLLDTVRSRCVTRYLSGEEDAPPPEAREQAERYLSFAAAGAELSLLSLANELSDLSGAELMDFVRAVRLLLTDMLCARLPDMKLPRREMLRLTELMDTAQTYLRFNVSVKHVLGLLSVDTVRN